MRYLHIAYIKKAGSDMLAVIPARGGSKGVPGKNIKELAGKPLIAYTIEAAIVSNIFEKVIVSTDDEKIAKIAMEYGADIPFMRPREISGDLVSSDDVILHAISFYHQKGIEYKEVCKLQPTSPLRKSKHLQEAYQLFREKEADFLVSVCECEHSPLWAGTIGKDLRLDEFIPEKVKRACRQDLPIYYRLNGAIYMAKTQSFCQNNNFLGKNSVAYIMNQEDSIDIDNELDFKMAEMIKGRL